MLPDRVSNPGPLTYESGALPIALRSPAGLKELKENGSLTSYVSTKIYGKHGKKLVISFYENSKKKKKKVKIKKNVKRKIWDSNFRHLYPRSEIITTTLQRH